MNTQETQEQVEEFDRMNTRKIRVLKGLCATCGLKDNHDELDINGRTFTHQFDQGVDAHSWSEIDWLTQALTLAEQHGAERERERVLNEACMVFDKYLLNTYDKVVPPKPMTAFRKEILQALKKDDE